MDHIRALTLFLIMAALMAAPAAAGEWTLTLTGTETTTLSSDDFLNGTAWTDGDVTYTGIPLADLTDLVDGNITEKGATVRIFATDMHDRLLSLAAIRNGSYMIASAMDGHALPEKDGDKKIAPLLLVGDDVNEDNWIGNIMRIEVIGGNAAGQAAPLRIIKYAEDGRTILNETTVSPDWMEKNLPVYGDGSTKYYFQGPTFDTDDLWNPAEDKNLAKVSDVVKGSAISDLSELVGGMEPGQRVLLTATDNYAVELDYVNIYNPEKRQGEAILSWWSGLQGGMPAYRAGYSLFFLTDDAVFGTTDMKECINPSSWRFYWCEGTAYPAASGLAVRKVRTLEILPPAKNGWNLSLHGHLNDTISREAMEQGLSCGVRGGGHLAEWTDSEGHVWAGMPLFLFAGWVDDDCMHDENLVNNKAYNTTLAENNLYTVRLTGHDNQTVELSSSEIMQSSGYIIANTKDNETLDPESPDWPLKLVGKSVPEDKQLGGVGEITLDFSKEETPLPWYLAILATCGIMLWRRRQ